MPAFSWCLFRSGFPATIRHAFVLSPVRARCSTHHLPWFAHHSGICWELQILRTLVFRYASYKGFRTFLCFAYARSCLSIELFFPSVWKLSRWEKHFHTLFITFVACVSVFWNSICDVNFFHYFVHIFIPESNSYDLWKEKLFDDLKYSCDSHSCYIALWSIPRGVTLTPHPLQVPWSRKCRAIPLLSLWAVRPVQNLSACTRVHFTLLICSISVLAIQTN
jgi:hypothetical protein